MADDDIKALRTLILDLKVEIAGLALAVRTMEKRLVKIEASISAPDLAADVYGADELDDLIKTRRPRAPRNDSE